MKTSSNIDLKFCTETFETFIYRSMQKSLILAFSNSRVSWNELYTDTVRAEYCDREIVNMKGQSHVVWLEKALIPSQMWMDSRSWQIIPLQTLTNVTNEQGWVCMYIVRVHEYVLCVTRLFIICASFHNNFK